MSDYLRRLTEYEISLGYQIDMAWHSFWRAMFCFGSGNIFGGVTFLRWLRYDISRLGCNLLN